MSWWCQSYRHRDLLRQKTGRLLTINIRPYGPGWSWSWNNRLNHSVFAFFFALALILFLKSYESRGTKVFRSKQKSPPNKKNHLLPLCYENKTKQKKGKNRKMPETHGKAHCSCLLLLFVWRRRRVRLLGAVINDLLPGQPKVVGRVDVQALSFTHFYITNPAKRQRIRNIYHKITGANTYWRNP